MGDAVIFNMNNKGKTKWRPEHKIEIPSNGIYGQSCSVVFFVFYRDGTAFSLRQMLRYWYRISIPNPPFTTPAFLSPMEISSTIEKRNELLWALLVVVPACSIAFFRKSWDHIIFLVISQLHYCARTTPFTSIVEFVIWIAHFTAFEWDISSMLATWSKAG